MEETRYIIQGGKLFGTQFEVINQEEPTEGDYTLFKKLTGATKIKVYKAKLELVKEIEIEEG